MPPKPIPVNGERGSEATGARTCGLMNGFCAGDRSGKSTPALDAAGIGPQTAPQPEPVHAAALAGTATATTGQVAGVEAAGIADGADAARRGGAAAGAMPKPPVARP